MKSYLISREETSISWFDCKQLLALLLFAGLDYNHLVILQEDSLSNLTYHPNHSVIANSALKLHIVNLTNLQVWYSSTRFQTMEPFLPLGKLFHIQTSLAVPFPDGIIGTCLKSQFTVHHFWSWNKTGGATLKLTLTHKYRDFYSSAWGINLIYYQLSAPW